MSEVSIGANFFHRKTVGHNNAVGGKLFEYRLVVFLPSLAVIAALARLHLNEIIADERKRGRPGRGTKPDDQIASEIIVDFTDVRDFAETSGDRGCWFLTLLRYTRLGRFVIELGDLRTHGGINFIFFFQAEDGIRDNVRGVAGNAQ